MWYNIDNNLREYIQSRLVAPECTIFRCPVINIIIHQSTQDIHRKRVEKTTKKDGKTAKKKRMIIMEKKTINEKYENVVFVLKEPGMPDFEISANDVINTDEEVFQSSSSSFWIWWQ